MDKTKADWKRIKTCPEPTLRRLPTYYHYLRGLQSAGRDVVSCTHIAQALKLDPTQIRKDLQVTGIVGKPKVGYEVNALIPAIELFLGWRNISDAFLAGVGSMGTALLKYDRFREYGLNIVAAFDRNSAKIGMMIQDKQVLSIDKLADLARRMHIHIGIITVPAESAQEVADFMIEGGINAIWNFAPTNLIVPDTVIIENVHLASSLSVLSNKLKNLDRIKV
ncbi:MAG: redox-sensing transcriptional repressor Rex [Candidatus Delongbacteria bacterium]|nr:redox-sensing transcriptional repressor Rex [Candidatus Delongbacteria bacterium]